MVTNAELLKMALYGYQVELQKAEAAVAEIEAELKGLKPQANATQTKKRRTLSAASKKRMAIAQKKRWKAYRMGKKVAGKTSSASPAE